MSIRFLFALLLLALLGACASPTPPRPDQLQFPPLQFSFPEVAQHRLQNGLQLYLKPDHELPLVELTLMIGGGSSFDPADKTGLSGLFAEGLETGGAGERSPQQLESELERMAAQLTVSSSSYAYQIDMSLRSRDLEQGLAILADLLRRPGFDAGRLELARKQMLEAIRRQNDNPSSIAGRALAGAVYGEHPFGRHATLASVRRIERSDLLQLHDRYFKPGNTSLAVSGDVEREQLLALLQTYLGDWWSAAVSDLTPPPLPLAGQPAVWVAEKDVPQTTILMGHPGIEKNNPDLFPLRVANYILGGGGFNSRLMREVRSNRGLAYSVYSYFQVGRRLPELFIASSATKSASTIEVVQLMRKLMRQLIEEPVTPAELQLAKESLINSFVFAFENSHSVVSRRLRLDFYAYPPGYLENYRDRLAAVSIADVQRVAREYLHPDQLQIVLVGRQQEFDQNPALLGLPVRQVELETDE